MRSIEIELQQGLLLIGPPTTFHRLLTSEVSDLATPQTLHALSRDTYALARLRRDWRELCPAQSSYALGDQQLVRSLIREIGTGRLKAIMLRDLRGRMRPLPPPPAQMLLIHVPLGDRTLLIAAKGRLPGQYAALIDNKGAAQALAGLESASEPAHLIDRQARRLPGNANGARLGAPLRQEIIRRLQFGACDAAVLTDRFAMAEAASRGDAPDAILNWSRDDRIYDALARASRLLPRELADASGLIIELGLLIATLVTQRGAASGRFSDSDVLVSIVYRLAREDGLEALDRIINAIQAAGGANREPELDAAARQFAEAFTAFGQDNGLAKLGELRRRLMARDRPQNKPAPQRRIPPPPQSQQAPPPAPAPAITPPPKPPAPEPEPESPKTKAVEKDGNKAVWTLDQNGRPTKVKATLAKLQPKHADRGGAELKAQTLVGDRGLDTDDAGHMIGHRFMGDQGIVNLFPQDSNLNRGAFKKVENEWADWIDQGCSVETTIELLDIVDDRPKEVFVAYKVFDKTGKQVFAKDKLFANEAGQTFDRQYKPDMKKLLKAAPPSPDASSSSPPSTDQKPPAPRKKTVLRKLAGPKK